MTTQSGLPVASFPTKDLETQVNIEMNGKQRKKPVNLMKDCPVSQLFQYECDERARIGARGEILREIKCVPKMRLFRRCPDGTTVETTRWEWEVARQLESNSQQRDQSIPAKEEKKAENRHPEG